MKMPCLCRCVLPSASSNRLLTCTARVRELPRRWNTMSTPSSSTRLVDALSSPPLERMQLAAIRCSTALPLRPEPVCFEGSSGELVTCTAYGLDVQILGSRIGNIVVFVVHVGGVRCEFAEAVRVRRRNLVAHLAVVRLEAPKLAPSEQDGVWPTPA